MLKDENGIDDDNADDEDDDDDDDDVDDDVPFRVSSSPLVL